MAGMSHIDPPAADAKPSRSVGRKPLAAAILIVLTGVFAAVNLDEVEVNWVLGTWSTPLVVVIAVSFLLGAGGGFLLATRRAKSRSG
jgi:uncharacterized integral membrane protein